jgi:aminopeptidase N
MREFLTRDNSRSALTNYNSAVDEQTIFPNFDLGTASEIVYSDPIVSGAEKHFVDKLTEGRHFFVDKEDGSFDSQLTQRLEEEFSSKYPWEIYRNVPVQDFIYGAMENTTATIFGDFYLQDSRAALERNYLSTNAHELVHQWFGDYITEWSGTHHWLHESFATHYAKHFKRTVLGEDDFQWERRKEMEGAWRASKRDNFPVAHSQGGSARHYPKGSIVIDMLRYVVGEENYKKVIGEFLAEHPYDLVDTHLFYLQFMKTLGVNLDWFFDQWLYRGGEPTYKVSYVKNKKNTEITVEQIHEQTDLIGLFKMPIIFQVFYKDGSFDEKTYWVENQKHTFVIEKEERKSVDFVLFDPNWKVLKNVEFEKSMFEWMAQAEKAPNMIDRYDAIVALKDLEIPMKRKFLSSLYEKETFHANKAAIVEILLNDDNEVSKNLISKALVDQDLLVRRQVLDKTKVIDKKHIKSFEKLLSDDSYVNIEKVLLKLCKDFPENCDKYLKETEKEEGTSKNIRISWLKLASAKEPKHLKELADYAGESFEFRTRIKAIQTLTELNYFDNVVMANIIDGYFNFNRVTSNSSKNAILTYSADNELKVRMLNYLTSIQKSVTNIQKLDVLLGILTE